MRISTHVWNHRHLPLTCAALLLAGLGACIEPEPLDNEELGTTEQSTLLGDLGVALGSPVATGNTIGLSNDFRPTCITNSNAPDASYTWTAPSTGTFTFDTTGSSFDTVLDILSFNTGSSLGCNDDSNNTLQSSVSVGLTAGQSVRVIIDGYGGGSGAFRLSIQASAAIPAAGLHLWLRSDAGVTLSGSQISRWVDQSGNGRNAAMSTAPRQPTYVAGALNGKPMVRFFGQQSMGLEITASPTTFTVFVMGRNSRTDNSFSMILGPGGNSPNNQLRWENGSQALFVGTGNNMPIITSSIGDTRAYHALSARYDGATMTVYRDGNATSSHAFSTSGPWILASVGSYYSSNFMVGDLGEVIIYNRVLTESERLSVNGYLRSKYGLP
jgi:Concanavalin A-like lectin/glucanases superfamily